MSISKKPFSWVDRDTAAHDLIQLVYHAPNSISLRALYLLNAIQSPSIVGELKTIFWNGDWPTLWRYHALQAIISAPADIYMPEIRKCLESDTTELAIENDAFDLAVKHASNQDWFLDYLDSLPLEKKWHRLFRYLCNTNTISHSELHYQLFDRLIAILEEQPKRLDLPVIKVLHSDSRSTTQEWLALQWQTILYLCLASQSEDLVYLLEEWADLKAILFASCPSIVPEYELRKANIAARERKSRKSVDLTLSPMWKEMVSLYEQARVGDAGSANKIEIRTHVRDVLSKTVAVHFLGKLLPNPTFLARMMNFVTSTDDYWVWQDEDDLDCFVTHFPVRFEAGAALCNYPSPQVWECLVDAYFVSSSYTESFRDWIQYQTDVLSGGETEYKGHSWQIEKRVWFKSLVNMAVDKNI